MGLGLVGGLSVLLWGQCWGSSSALLVFGGRDPAVPPSPPVPPAQAKYKAREAAMKAQSEKKHGSDKEERGKLPESPKTAEEIWQQSVIGDYLARFKVRSGLGKGLEGGGVVTAASRNSHVLSPWLSHLGLGWELWGGRGSWGEQCPSGSTPVSQGFWVHLMHFGGSVPQNDRGKALKAMEATWNNMEKKEKLMWIKKAAEDQKRYEVGPCPRPVPRHVPHLVLPLPLTLSLSCGSEGAERDAGPSVLHQLHQENEVPGRAEETPYVSTWGVKNGVWLCW